VRRANGEDCNVRPDDRVGRGLSDDPARRGPQGHRRRVGRARPLGKDGTRMNNIFWIIGVIVVVIAVLGFFGLR
jgi:hypothetical protein